MGKQIFERSERLGGALRKAHNLLGACHVVMEGPNARWVEFSDGEGGLDGFYDEDLVCRPDCPVCETKREIEATLDMSSTETSYRASWRPEDYSKLWHDDIRRPPDETWFWARTNREAVRYLLLARCEEASLDHDLGLHEMDPDETDAPLGRGSSYEGNGVDLVKVMLALSRMTKPLGTETSNRIKRGCELTIAPEMLDRAEHALRSLGFEGPDRRDCAEAILTAAFEGVPMSNYSIGTLLQWFDHVICLRGGGAGVYVRNGEPDGFDALSHNRNYRYRKDGSLSSVSFTKLGEDDDE